MKDEREEVNVTIDGIPGPDRHRISCLVERLLGPLGLRPTFTYSDYCLVPTVFIYCPTDAQVIEEFQTELRASGYPEALASGSEQNRSAA